ncbi:MAG: HlyC/CorC family transporter [Chloroflexi bacterium]|nr:MAG: HlyC/CorC family transporter [Chloroflexota bacterium]
MSIIVFVFATVALMIFINALYVAAEFSTVASRRTKISQLAAEGNRMAQSLLPIMEDKARLDSYVAACQVGITISSLVLGAYGQNVIAGYLIAPMTGLIEWMEPFLQSIGMEVSDTVATTAATSISTTGVLILLTFLQVIMGELFPKSVAIQYPEQVALGVVVPMKWSLWILRPLIWFLNGSGGLILRLLGRDMSKGHGGHAHSPEEIELLVTESHEGGLLDDRERQLLRNALRLRELTARQVMVHRTRLVAVPAQSTVLEVMEKAIEVGYSRIPVYQESIDDIIGFVHIKDLFRLHVQGMTEIDSIIRDVVYVPETMPVTEVWRLLNTKRKYVAVVFDEYGGTAGLITFEDVIEEIFGEVQDEFDDEMALIARDKEGRIYLRGDLLVSDVNEYLGLDLPEETADTLSGLVISELGRLPNVGDIVQVGDIEIRVEAMSDPGVGEISLKLPVVDQLPSYSEWEVAEHE